ncbi:MAG TPA: cytochrome c [Longimicrobium sp.]|nr:cytochrome c [Longimicrobium sp.]
MRNVRGMMMTAALLLAVFSGCDRGAGGGASKGGDAKGAAAPGDPGPPPGQLPQGVTAKQGNEGRTLYRNACVMCHGEGGRGTPLGPSLVDNTWTQGTGSFEEITRVVTEGAPATEAFGVPMPPRGHGAMTDEQIRAVSAYTYSLARPNAGGAAK